MFRSPKQSFAAPSAASRKSGRVFTTAVLLVKEGDDGQFWKWPSPKVCKRSLCALADGEKRMPRGVIADNILALRQAPKQRAANQSRTCNDGRPPVPNLTMRYSGEASHEPGNRY